MVKILAFGASITLGKCDPGGGWVQHLNEHLQLAASNTYLIYNLGISGDTTKDVLERFVSETKQRLREDEDEELIFIFSIGINDSQYLHDKKCIRIAPEEFRENLKNLMKTAQKYSSKIVFVGFAPVDDKKTDPIPWDKNKTYKNEYIRKFNNIAQEVCKENNVHFIEIFSRFKQIGDIKLLEDGIHPTAEGHQKIFELVRDFLNEHKLI